MSIEHPLYTLVKAQERDTESNPVDRAPTGRRRE